MIFGEGSLVDLYSNRCKYSMGFIIGNGGRCTLSPTSFPIFRLPSTSPSTQTRPNSHPDSRSQNRLTSMPCTDFLLGFQCTGDTCVCSELIRNRVLVSTTDIHDVQSPISRVYVIQSHVMHVMRHVWSCRPSFTGTPTPTVAVTDQPDIYNPVSP